jgi:hypothetical protein
MERLCCHGFKPAVEDLIAPFDQRVRDPGEIALAGIVLNPGLCIRLNPTC